MWLEKFIAGNLWDESKRTQYKNSLSWADSVFQKNWVVRLDFTRSTHLEACSVDGELHTSLVANSCNNLAGKMANQYNLNVV